MQVKIAAFKTLPAIKNSKGGYAMTQDSGRFSPVYFQIEALEGNIIPHIIVAR